MNYDIWPGIGLSETPVDWVKHTGSAALSAKSTANVDRRRKAGKDFSTLRGISKKSDELSNRGAPATIRRPSRPVGHRGPAVGQYLDPDSRTGKIRSVLLDGPMTRAELCAAVGIKPDSISAYLKNDIQKGRILKIVEEGQLQRFALAELE